MAIDPGSVTILLVEDAAVMRNIEIKTLKTLGFEKIIQAEDGEIATRKLESIKEIDIVISDWNMPNKDGLELLKWIRNSPAHRNLPFIMATGQGDKAQQQRAVEAGVSSFIAKPFDATELRRKIDEAFGIQEDAGEEADVAPGPQLAASGKVKLRVAHIQITDHLVLGVLKHMIEKGEYQPRHFELETLCMPGWNPVADALEKGKVDAACILAPIAMDMFRFDVPIRLILLAHKNGSTFVRSRSGAYTQPYAEYFRGKSFLVPHKLSIHHMLAHLFFKKIGLTAGMEGVAHVDVNVEVVAPIKMPEFLASNPGACGYMVAEPIGTKGIASGIAELQFLSAELWNQHPCCVVTMRDDFIGPYKEAVYEFTQLLVRAGAFIEEKPELSAEIAVRFLDPEKRLGLKVPLLKNVLKEELGIKSGDLLPIVSDFEIIQKYMVEEMGIGGMIDLERFIDLRFAKAAYQDRVTGHKPSVLQATEKVINRILLRGTEADESSSKQMLNKEGKYLTFRLGDQEFGIDILKIKEIIGMMPIRSIPSAEAFVKGVIKLRDKIIPVTDLRLKFGMQEIDYTDRTCIIVLDLMDNGSVRQMGIVVDTVLEVLNIKAADIEDTPLFGTQIDTTHILAMAKIENGVKILLDIDSVMGCREVNNLDATIL